MPKKIHKRWQQIKTLILLRPVPHTIMSWRFLLPGQSNAVKLHRKVFLHAWPTLPRIGWALIALYSTITWLCFFSWRQIYRSYRTHGKKLKEQFNISQTRQVLDLLNMTFLHSIPPNNYYLYSLFNQPREKWLDYVYPFQLSQWHSAMSAKSSAESQHLLTSKHDFAHAMEKAGLPAVRTIEFIKNGSAVKHEQIFTEHSLFLKPNTGNQRKGCFELHYLPEKIQYELHTPDIVTGKTNILEFLNQRFKGEDYIVQPLLENHPQIASLCHTNDLVTLRLVTGMIQTQPALIFALLEIPVTEKPGYVWHLPINPQTGVINHGMNTLFQEKKRQLIEEGLEGKTIPLWEEMRHIVLTAHQNIQDVPTIGWDIVCSSNGLKLLEGNTGWAIAPHQTWSSEPVLNGLLKQVYINYNQDNPV